jgi:gliding motility-associated protein GldC
MAEQVDKSSNITVKVGLSSDKIPVKIEWMADDDPSDTGWTEIKAMMISLFDLDTRDTLRIDLWTKEMRVDEMDRFMFQTLRAMADTYHRATQNAELANEMQHFVDYFGKKTGIITAEG